MTRAGGGARLRGSLQRKDNVTRAPTRETSRCRASARRDLHIAPHHGDSPMTDAPVFETDLHSLRLLHRGKVRDIYEVDADRLLIVQTDRLSAFDVILPTPVPGKGKVLTALSNFWFRRLAHVIPNHLTGTDPLTVVAARERDQIADRAFVVRRLAPLPIEAIVRGYVAGSGWKDYRQTGAICGIPLPAGLQEASKLPEPIFTPSTKAPKGTHDENIGFAEAERLLGAARAAAVRDAAVRLYREAAEYADSRGIIIADTKFEFGTDAAGTLVLIDEALTPDSSRFWPKSQYRVGASPPSFDKQFVRDWLEARHWNKQPPAPALPPDVLARTAEKYAEALRLLTS
jgi:phosphoribosylaminoimidazole-succinocarboxamide synthase